MTNNKQNHSGTTCIKNDRIVWQINGQKVVDHPIKHIELIAEYTTSNGPFEDDWFLLFFDDQGASYRISMYAEQITDMMSELGNQLHTELIPSLFASTELNSKILYPKAIKGQKLWHLTQAKPKSMWEHIRAIFGKQKTEVHLNEEAKKIIKRQI